MNQIKKLSTGEIIKGYLYRKRFKKIKKILIKEDKSILKKLLQIQI